MAEQINHPEVHAQIETEVHTEAQTNAEMHETGHEGGHFEHSSSLYAEPIFHIGNYPVTNALLTSWVAVFVLIVAGLFLRLKMKTIPGKLQHLFELLVDGALNLCDQVTGDRKLSLRIFPITICLFLFILINNWLALLPGTAVGVVQDNVFVPFLRSGTADLNTTLALAIIAVIGSNIFGVIIIGLWKVINKYLNFNAIGQAFKTFLKDPTVIIVAPIKFFVGIIEIVGELAKIASLSFRLFGNVFAGEILLVSMSVLVAYLVPLPFLFLEILVGFVQALIFSMLTLVYFTIASHDHDEHPEEAHGEHGEVKTVSH